MTNLGVEKAFRLYGDNILECMNLINWLKQTNISGFTLTQSIGPIDRPVFLFSSEDPSSNFAIHMCPFYGTGQSRWTPNPITGVFNEKVDALLIPLDTQGNNMEPILAIEYVDSIQAGNQAWQRSRRPIDAAKKGIPYLHVLPLLRYEPEPGGENLKTARFVSSQVAMSQLALTEKYRVPCLQIYLIDPCLEYAEETGETLPTNWRNFQGEQNGIVFVSNIIKKELLGGQTHTEEFQSKSEQIISEMIEVVYTYSMYKNTRLPLLRNHPLLQPNTMHTTASNLTSHIFTGQTISNGLSTLGVSELLAHGSVFNKSISPDKTTPRAIDICKKLSWRTGMTPEEKKAYLQFWGVSVPQSYSTSSQLKRLRDANRTLIPLTYKAIKSEGVVVQNPRPFTDYLCSIYNALRTPVENWLREQTDFISIVPMSGYKPKGDSRPDRGLLPMLASFLPRLFSKEKTLVFMYSKYAPTEWCEILDNRSNELWNVISEYAGAVLVDKTETGRLL